MMPLSARVMQAINISMNDAQAIGQLLLLGDILLAVLGMARVFFYCLKKFYWIITISAIIMIAWQFKG
jgi:hypothetical protein